MYDLLATLFKKDLQNTFPFMATYQIFFWEMKKSIYKTLIFSFRLEYLIDTVFDIIRSRNIN